MPGLLESYYYWTRSRDEEAPPPAPDYEAGVLALSPTAYWPMQEASGNLTDATGNGWTATVNGSGLTYAQSGPTINGEATNAILFPAGTGWFTVSSSLTDPSTSGYTLTGWAKHPAGTGPKAFFYWVSSGQGTFWLGKGNGYGMQNVPINTAGDAYLVPFGTDLNDTWVFVAARLDTSGTDTAAVWKDSTKSTDTAAVGTWKRDGNPSCGIGATATGAFGWNGSIAHVAYWNTPLSDADIDKLRTGVF